MKGKTEKVEGKWATEVLAKYQAKCIVYTL